LQVAAPFDLYFLNDISEEVTAVLARRARAVGVAGAQVFELDLRQPDYLVRAAEIASVHAPWGPKIVVTTGDANIAHLALKQLVPQRRRYICCVIDPQSAIYEWNALAGLRYGERHIDVLELFPDEIDLCRGLPYYLREGRGHKLDRYFPDGIDWRGQAKRHAHPQSALRRLYEEQMELLLGLRIGHTKTVAMRGRAMYRLIFASPSTFAIDLWQKIVLRTPGEFQQDELFLGV
jgi:hypothetical protein